MQDKNKSIGIRSIFIILMPFLTLIYTLFNNKQYAAKNIFWVGCMFMGLIQIYDPIIDMGADITSYAEYFKELTVNPISIDMFISRLYSTESGSTDIYQPLMSYMVSSFTDNPHILFFFFAAVFGYFYSRNIWYIFDVLPFNKGVFINIILLAYILVCPIWEINGVRMWTALHVFVYAVMPYVLYRDKKKLYWLVFCVFIHFTYTIVISIFLIYYFLPKRINLFFILYLITLTIKELDLQFISDFMTRFVPIDVVQDKISTYVSEDSLDELNKRLVERSFIATVIYDIISYIYPVIMILSYFLYNQYKQFMGKKVYNLLSFVLLYFVIANILSIIPFASRFLVIGNMFLVPLFIFILFSLPLQFRKRVTWVAILFIPFIAMQIRIAMNNYGVSLFGNFFIAPFINDNVPFSQLF